MEVSCWSSWKSSSSLSSPCTKGKKWTDPVVDDLLNTNQLSITEFQVYCNSTKDQLHIHYGRWCDMGQSCKYVFWKKGYIYILWVSWHWINDAYTFKMKIALSNNLPERTNYRLQLQNKYLYNSICTISNFRCDNSFNH